MLTFMFPSNTSRGYGFHRIENTLESIQHEVGGYIEVVPLRENLVMILDEEGKIKNKRKNELANVVYHHYHPTSQDFIVGNALLVTTNGEDFDNFDMKYYKEIMNAIKERWGI